MESLVMDAMSLTRVSSRDAIDGPLYTAGCKATGASAGPRSLNRIRAVGETVTGSGVVVVDATAGCKASGSAGSASGNGPTADGTGTGSGVVVVDANTAEKSKDTITTLFIRELYETSGRPNTESELIRVNTT